MCVCVCVFYFPKPISPFFATTTTTTILVFVFFGKGTKRKEKEETNGYGHTKRKAPLLARSVKLSLFGLGQYQGWRQPGNSECCNLFAIYFLFLLFVILFLRECMRMHVEKKEKREVGRASSFYYFSHSKIKKALFYI